MTVRYGLSTRSDGSMFLGDASRAARYNRELFFTRCGIEPQRVVSAGLEHGAHIKVVTTAEAGAVVSGDGLVTTAPDLYVALTVADCFPVWAYDATSGVVGLAHAGWRGVAAGVVLNLVAAMREAGASLRSCRAVIGAGIQVCHFEVQADVAVQFQIYRGAVMERDSRTYMDLPAAIRQQLISAGVPTECLDTAGECTYCLSQRYFSSRRDRARPLEAMIAYIGTLTE